MEDDNSVESEADPRGDSEFMLVEGRLTELHVERGTQNLFEKLDLHYKGKAVLSAVAASAANLYGSVASSAMVAMHDGEETENFIAQVNNKVVCGQFAGASSLPDGKVVKAVVRREGDVYQAVSIIDEERGYLWINHAKGRRAELISNIKIGFWLWISAAVFFGALTLFVGTSKNHINDYLFLMLGTAVLLLAMAFWNSSTLNTLADPTTKAFELFGFDEASKINIRRYLVYLLESAEHEKAIQRDPKAREPEILRMMAYANNDIYNYRRAIQDGHIRVKPPTS